MPVRYSCGWVMVPPPSSVCRQTRSKASLAGYAEVLKEGQIFKQRRSIRATKGKGGLGPKFPQQTYLPLRLKLERRMRLLGYAGHAFDLKDVHGRCGPVPVLPGFAWVRSMFRAPRRPLWNSRLVRTG